MKRKILALVCAAVMVMGMSITVLAAPSPNSGSTAGSGNGSSSATSGGVANSAGSSVTESLGNQVFNEAKLQYFAEDTKVEGGTVKAVDMATLRDAYRQATLIYGADTFIATIVDINVPGATFPYNLTIQCSNVWAGQTVTILHKVGDQWERLKPSAVADNSVTVTVNSFSPFAIVIDTNPSPKTNDIALMVSGLAGLFATGTVFTYKKRK